MYWEEYKNEFIAEGNLQNISIKNVFCSGAGQAILMQGLPEMPLSGLTMENINISAKKGIVSIDADQISMKDINIIAEKGSILALFNNRNISVEGPR